MKIGFDYGTKENLKIAKKKFKKENDKTLNFY